MVSTPGFSIFATIRCRSSISQQRRPLPAARPTRTRSCSDGTAEIARSDSFIFVAPEYNYGPSAVLKDAIDWVYPSGIARPWAS